MMNDSPAMPHHADREELARRLEVRADAFRELGFNAVEIAAMVRQAGEPVSWNSPSTLQGMIAAIYEGLDEEDCAWVDAQWAEWRGTAIDLRPSLMERESIDQIRRDLDAGTLITIHDVRTLLHAFDRPDR